ncbi:MAG: 3-hydroxy-3-methylglutaryl-CoA reductase, partial [Candidatus Methanomethylophilaceae archaeon]
MEASMDGREGLKNRGYSRADVDERRHALETVTGTELNNIAAYSFDPLQAQKNIENMIGVIQVPLGFCGPLPIDGEAAQGEFYIPLATTEGALLASVNRGCTIIRKSAPVKTAVFHDAMTRAPVMRVKDIAHSQSVIDWIGRNMDSLQAEVAKTTSHGKLLDVLCLPNGRNLFLRFSYYTGDAMGMNMATIATES